jgi:hypothetical protein
MQIQFLFENSLADCHISLDGWTGRNNCDFMTIVVHWIDPDFKLRYRCLGVIPIKGTLYFLFLIILSYLITHVYALQVHTLP